MPKGFSQIKEDLKEDENSNNSSIVAVAEDIPHRECDKTSLEEESSLISESIDNDIKY